MFISHKSNAILSIHDSDWQCRRFAKGLDKSDYFAWLETIKDSDGNPDYSGEDYTIVECMDEDVTARLGQLRNYVHHSPETGTVYNIKWSDSRVNGSHFVADDTARDKRILDSEWVNLRRHRSRLLAETDWMTCSDSPAMSDANKTYRQKLRDLPNDQKDKKTFADITWPTKP